MEDLPSLVASDIERIVIRTNWTNEVSERHEVHPKKLTDPARLAVLKAVFSEPERLRLGKIRAALTTEAVTPCKANFLTLPVNSRRIRCMGYWCEFRQW